MGTTAPGPIHLLELCDQKLMEFLCTMDNKDLVWLEEIQEEAMRMFTREFSKEPELMPKTPSQKNRRKKRRISYVEDENRDPIRKRLSRRKSRSSQLSSRRLRRKDSVEKLATLVGENGSVLRRVTRAAAAAAAATLTLAAPSPTPESPTMLTKKPEDSRAQCQLVPVVEIGNSERQNAEQHLTQLTSAQPLPHALPLTPASAAATAPASQGILASDEESTPKKSKARILESVTVSSLMATPQDPKGQGVGTGRSVSKLRIAQVSPGPQDLPGSPDSQWQERILAPILPDNFSTPTGSGASSQLVRRSQIAPSSPGPQVSAQKNSPVTKQESVVRRASRRLAKKTAEEPAPSGRIICHSYLERLLNVEVPQKVGAEQKESPEEAEPVVAAEPEVPENNGNNSWPRDDTRIANGTPNPKLAASSQETPSAGQQEAKMDQADGPREPPQSARRKRSYKQAVSELDEDQHLEDEELQPPRSKTPSSPCPASKVVRPLRTFLHTVQRNQMLMTPTSAPRSVMKSFIKRNTPLRVDPKEKERQRLENLRRKEEAEQLRRQKVEEDKRRRLEEVKLKREERLRKVLQARERVEQMQEEKKKQIEQKFAQIDEKTEKAKEERLAEEKAKKKAAAKKMEEVEARRKQEEEARRLRWLQQVRAQEEEERRHQELLQKKKEEELERLRKAAEAKRLAEQREQERRERERREQEQREQERQLAEQERRREQERLQAEREQQEREKALRLQKERQQRELEEKKKKEEQQRLAERQLQEEQEKKAKEAAGASKVLNVTVDVQSPACTSYQMTPQGHRAPPKINPDNYGMDLNSDDSTDDEAHPRKPIPTWARGTPLSQAIINQYYHPPNLLELFGAILPLDLEDIFKKSKPRYHKRTSSAVWNSPPLQGARVPSSLAYSLKKY
ncbi:inner centromere protein isoform X1 [Saimiri boliviensis]|uniref:inner centromere protein isoform X1 n=1 Tax=Saimiri boliviensis TaxID=27679 RepID=UPI000533CF54|nr:inner centromere protein isoform X3 [Saimiri boliviensis boliviensis]